jgi:hypothetical protein
MGLFEKIFGKKPEPQGQYVGEYKLLDGYKPVFHRFDGSIYESELVRAAINAIATQCGKLQVVIQGAAKPALQTKLRRAPNELLTWSQFLTRLASILYIHNTAFIVPVYDMYGEVSGIYPVLPDKCEVVGYKTKGTVVPYLRYTFRWNETAAIELENVGIMTRFQYRHDLFGEDNHALIPTMDLISMQDQGIKEGLKNGASFRWVARTNNFIKTEDLKKERLRFSAANFAKDADGGGLLLFPNTYSDIQQVKSNPFIVDADQSKLIRESVFDYFGVNEDVLQNKAYGDAWSAFYEGVIEPFAVQFSEVMTKMLFTFREQASGSRIVATANRLQYMTNADKLNVSAQMMDRGLMTRNEIREIWNLPPVDGGDEMMIRAEYVNANERTENDET